MITVEAQHGCSDAESLFNALPATGCRFLLDSSLEGPQGRYCIACADPFLILTARGSRVRITDIEGTRETKDDPFEVLRSLLRRYQMPGDKTSSLPFTGGAVGYLGYELGRHVEKLPSSGTDDLRLPELALAFCDRAWVLDRKTGRTVRVTRRIRGVDPEAPRGLTLELDPAPLPEHEGPNFTREDYENAVRQAWNYVVAGDIFQANIAQRYAQRLPGDPWSFYRTLRRTNPAPFSAFLDFGRFAVASSSPERFLRIEGQRVETRPIKGTVRRSEDSTEDARLARELLASEKDRAELAMIVDLERNDLGRVCRPGTVKVSEARVLESYETVHHLVATVEGELEQGRDTVDLLRASFPGGSITGAPKIRAMEIIDELEPHARGVYTGSIGYLGFDGRSDLNIAIRTVSLRDGWATFHVGGGIVADSVPAAEYRETQAKAAGIVAALNKQGAPP